MKKVVVKCRLKNRDEFEQKLADIDLDFGPIVWQHDRVYLPRGYKVGGNFPRVLMRTEMRSVDRPAQHELILKRHIKDSGVDVVNRTLVRDYNEATQMLHQLGFKLAGEVSRRRRELKMVHGVTIFMDKVEGLNGSYAKMEVALEEGDSVKAVREDLLKTLAVLGQKSTVAETYIALLEKKKLEQA